MNLQQFPEIVTHTSEFFLAPFGMPFIPYSVVYMFLSMSEMCEKFWNWCRIIEAEYNSHQIFIIVLFIILKHENISQAFLCRQMYKRMKIYCMHSYTYNITYVNIMLQSMNSLELKFHTTTILHFKTTYLIISDQ